MGATMYANEVKARAVSMVMAGATLRQAEAACGPSRQTIGRWVGAAGIEMRQGWIGGPVKVVRSAGAARPGRLMLEQRLAIAAGVAAGLTHAEIAAGIGFSRPTVSRELARHAGPGGAYDPYAAHAEASRDARRPKPRKLDASRRLRRYVLGRLAERWSPEQVSAMLGEEFPGDEEMSLSAESIYQALYVQGKGSLRQELKVEKALRTGRTSRVPRSALPPRGDGASWVDGCEISLRPAEAGDRAVPGHWEGDLVVGGDMSSCLVTLVERSSRLVLVRRLDLHPTSLVTAELADMASRVPEALMRSVTWDRGCEMAGHAAFTERTGVRVYFCDPHSPWQRGSNENTNGLIRDFFPKGTRFCEVTDEEVARVQHLLNTRPRKTLGWKTPQEAYSEYLRKVEEGALTT